MTRRKKKEAERNRQITMHKRSKRCTGKKSYDTEIEAEGYAKLYSDPRYGKRGESKLLSSYLCPLCYKFHLTSRIKANKTQINA